MHNNWILLISMTEPIVTGRFPLLHLLHPIPGRGPKTLVFPELGEKPGGFDRVQQMLHRQIICYRQMAAR
jgi:hypothetical protein